MGKSKRNKKAIKARISAIEVGMSADDALALAGGKPRSHVEGSDENGLIVHWVFPDAKAIFELRRVVHDDGSNWYAITDRIR